MNVEQHLPSSLLRPFIRSFTIISTSEETETLVLPHCGLVMATQFRGKVRNQQDDGLQNIPSVVLSGMRKTWRRFRYEKDAGTLLITFTETGAASFFRAPVYELFEQYYSLDAFEPAAEVRKLEDRVASASHNRQRIRVVEEFFLQRLNSSKQDSLVLNVIREIYQRHGATDIRSLSTRFVLSQDAFEKRFRKLVGCTPKQFSGIVRMKSLVSLAGQKKSLTELGYQFEFYDQSHFIREFRSFTGQSPREFFKAPYPW
ncbi:MAG TPA: helix-turn-helix domain-containing protein [Puia sp.]|nr:helix-turn-helix domain-containing protein [Puia sp.]